MSHKEFVDDDFLYEENYDSTKIEKKEEKITDDEIIKNKIEPLKEKENQIATSDNHIKLIEKPQNINGSKPKENKINTVKKTKNSNKKLFTISNKNKEVLKILSELQNNSDSDYICQAIIEKYYNDKNICNNDYNKKIDIDKLELKKQIKETLNELIDDNFIILKGSNSFFDSNYEKPELEKKEEVLNNNKTNNNENKQLLLSLMEEDDD